MPLVVTRHITLYIHPFGKVNFPLSTYINTIYHSVVSVNPDNEILVRHAVVAVQVAVVVQIAGISGGKLEINLNY